MSKVLTLGKRIRRLAEAFVDHNEVQVKVYALDIDHEDVRARFECIVFDTSDKDKYVAIADGQGSSSLSAMREALTNCRKLIVDTIEENDQWNDELRLTLIEDNESLHA